MSEQSSPQQELALLAASLRSEIAFQKRTGRRYVDLQGQVSAEAARSASTSSAAPVAQVQAKTSRAQPQAPTQTQGSSQAPAGASAPETQAPQCASLDQLRLAVADCTACELSKSRTQTVFSDGNGQARVAFVGEAPGYYEDQQGTPFVGKAGQLLTDIITKGMRLKREDCYIANVLKCRPPENRDPSPGEKALCTHWLDRQLDLSSAEVVIALGRHAANHLLGTDESMGRLRGRVHQVAHKGGSRKVVATYHPAYLLRSPHMKKEAWKDIQLAMAELGLPQKG